jgi:hypothetical protein
MQRYSKCSEKACNSKEANPSKQGRQQGMVATSVAMPNLSPPVPACPHVIPHNHQASKEPAAEIKPSLTQVQKWLLHDVHLDLHQSHLPNGKIEHPE